MDEPEELDLIAVKVKIPAMYRDLMLELAADMRRIVNNIKTAE